MNSTAIQRNRCPNIQSGPCPLRGGDGERGCSGNPASQRIHIVRRGTHLYSQGDPAGSVYCVLRGLISLDYIDDDGGIAILSLVRAGNLLGCADLFNGNEHRTSARAIEDSVVCALSETALIDAVAMNGAFSLRLLKAAATESQALGAFAQRMACLPVEARILSLMEELSMGREIFTLPVTKKDLAFMAGTSPEVLSRTLVKLQRAGSAHVDGNAVTLPRYAPPKVHIAG